MTQSILSEKNFLHFCNRQKTLDSYIREMQGITDEQWLNEDSLRIKQSIALTIEQSKFANECKDLFKYWKNNPQINRENLLDEAVDVIHFINLFLLKIDVDLSSFIQELNDGYAEMIVKINESENTEMYEVLGYFLETDHLVLKYITLLIILGEHYDVTEEELLKAFNKKNAINRKRQDDGY